MFEIGDVVKLKSGGPQMTISGTTDGSDTSRVHCIWFSDEVTRTAVFPAAGLKLVKAKRRSESGKPGGEKAGKEA